MKIQNKTREEEEEAEGEEVVEEVDFAEGVDIVVEELVGEEVVGVAKETKFHEKTWTNKTILLNKTKQTRSKQKVKTQMLAQNHYIEEEFQLKRKRNLNLGFKKFLTP